MRALLFAAAMAIAGQADAADRPIILSSINTPMLVQSCNEPRQLLSLDFCAGYVLGAFDRLSLSHVICPTGAVATASAMGVALKFMNDNPARWGEPPAHLLEGAFIAAFPCTR